MRKSEHTSLDSLKTINSGQLAVTAGCMEQLNGCWATVHTGAGCYLAWLRKSIESSLSAGLEMTSYDKKSYIMLLVY